jgi:hypothetical protein
MGTSRVRTLGSLIRAWGANGSAIAEGDVFAAESNEKERAEYGFVESPWVRKQGRGSPRPLASTFKKDPTKKENFLTLMKILQSFHITTYFMESVYINKRISISVVFLIKSLADSKGDKTFQLDNND